MSISGTAACIELHRNRSRIVLKKIVGREHLLARLFPRSVHRGIDAAEMTLFVVLIPLQKHQ